MRRVIAILAALLAAAPASADPITITKSVTLVSDPLGNLLPRSLPGSVADYRTLATNPVGNLTKPVRNLVLVETLPATTDLRVADLVAAGKGPVEFADGSVLGTGLLAGGVTYAFVSLGSTTDSIEFWDGTSWSYQPVPESDGYDRNVRAMRITLGSTFTTLGSFQLRYRVRIR